MSECQIRSKIEYVLSTMDLSKRQRTEIAKVFDAVLLEIDKIADKCASTKEKCDAIEKANAETPRQVTDIAVAVDEIKLLETSDPIETVIATLNTLLSNLKNL